MNEQVTILYYVCVCVCVCVCVYFYYKQDVEWLMVWVIASEFRLCHFSFNESKQRGF